MSPVPINAEIVARLAVGEKASGSFLTPEQTEANNLITENEKNGSAASLKVAADRLDHQQVERANEKAIGSTRDKDGKIKRNGEEKERHKDAVKETELINTFLDQGYDKLDSGQKTIEGYVEGIVNSVPALKAVYNTSSDKVAFLEKIAQNPDFSHLVADVARGILDPSKIKPEIVSSIRIEIANTEQRIREIEGKLKDDSDNLTKRIGDLEDDLKELVEGGEVETSGRVKATKVDKMRGQMVLVNNQIGPLDKEVKSLQRQADYIESILNSAESAGKSDDETTQIKVGEKSENKKVSEIRNMFGSVQQRISEKENTLVELAIQRKALESRLARYDEGDFEKNLKKDLDDARKEKNDLEKEKRELTETLDKKRITLVDAQNEREFEEKDYVKKLQNVFSEASKKYIEQRLTEAEASYKNTLTAEAATSEDKAMAQLKDQIGLTLFDSNGKVKIEDVKNEFNEMIKDNNPDTFLEKLLKQKGTYKLEDTQVEALKKDPVKWNKLRLELGSQVVKLYSLRGGWGGRYGKIHSEIAMKLKSSSWGTEVVAQGIEGARKEIESLTGQKLPAGNKLGEWLRKQDLGKWTLIISGIGIAILLFFLLKK